MQMFYKVYSGKGPQQQFVAIDRTTRIYLPGEMTGWLDQNSLARFVVEVVQPLDISWVEALYRGGGSAPYPPRRLLALMFYCYAKGIFK
jgi:hypothetical protein